MVGRCVFPIEVVFGGIYIYVFRHNDPRIRKFLRMFRCFFAARRLVGLDVRVPPSMGAPGNSAGGGRGGWTAAKQGAAAAAASYLTSSSPSSSVVSSIVHLPLHPCIIFIFVFLPKYLACSHQVHLFLQPRTKMTTRCFQKCISR